MYVTIFISLAGLPTGLGYWLTKLTARPIHEASYVIGVLSFVSWVLALPLVNYKQLDINTFILISTSMMVGIQLFYWYLFERVSEYYEQNEKNQTIVSGDNSVNVQVNGDLYNK